MLQHVVVGLLWVFQNALCIVTGLLPKFQQHCEHLCQKWTSAIKTNTEGPTVVDIQSSISNMVKWLLLLSIYLSI